MRRLTVIVDVGADDRQPDPRRPFAKRSTVGSSTTQANSSADIGPLVRLRDSPTNVPSAPLDGKRGWAMPGTLMARSLSYLIHIWLALALMIATLIFIPAAAFFIGTESQQVN